MITTLNFEGHAVFVYPQETVASALRRNNFEIALHCGGKNRCGSCRILLLSGTFVSDGKILTVSEDNPVEVNSCSLKMLTNGAAKYCKREHSKTTPCLQMPEIPKNFQPTLVLDLGTTNVEGVLLRNGTFNSASQVNRQTVFGDNIIDRIAFASNSDNRIRLIDALIKDTLQPLISALTDTPEEISKIIVAGNTAMTHFFFDADTEKLGKSPFQPDRLKFSSIAGKLGLGIVPADTPVVSISCLGGFIGGDVTAGLFFTGFGKEDSCELFMDIGTNCEILLNKHGRFYALSAAAGPAFERNNVRADAISAVKHVAFENNEWKMSPQKTELSGYCGTALIDLLAEGRQHGFLNTFAQWVNTPDLPEKLQCSNGMLAELLTAKAAIESALLLLFKHADVTAESLDRIYLAGNFSQNLNLANAKFIRLLPDLPDERFIRCGNAALNGSILCALNPQILSLTEKIRQMTLVLNPAEEPDYTHYFTSAMSL